jgi:hypothetical protein
MHEKTRSDGPQGYERAEFVDDNGVRHQRPLVIGQITITDLRIEATSHAEVTIRKFGEIDNKAFSFNFPVSMVDNAKMG